MTPKTFETRATALIGFPVTIAVRNYFRSTGTVCVHVYLPVPTTCPRADGKMDVRLQDEFTTVVRGEKSVARVLDRAWEKLSAAVRP